MYKITEELLYQCIPIADERIYQAQKQAMPQSYRVSETFDQKIHSMLKKANHPRWHFSLMKVGGKVATVVLAVLLAGMTITMTVPQARARFFEIIRRVHSTYDEIHYKNVRGETEVHTRPGWIPPGMKLHEEAVDEDFYLASWHSEDDEKVLCLMASLIDDSAGALLNNEFSQTETILWNGDEVLVGKLKDEEGWELQWYHENILCDLSGSGLSKSDMLRVLKHMSY